MKTLNLTLVVLTSYLLILNQALASAAQSFGPRFKIAAPPTTGDWQRFHIMPEPALKDLWSFHARKKLALRDWSWQWRLAWVRACGDARRWGWCEGILKDGLFDAAMVVRAESAVKWAEARRGKAGKSDVELLSKAYGLKENSRNGKSLYVCERILSALASFQTKESLAAAKGLARKNKRTLAYWNSLQANQKKYAKSALSPQAMAKPL